MKLFKRFIPKEKMQTVTELESWTVTWKLKKGGYGYKVHSTVFINIEHANEFARQLREQAKFIGCWIEVEMYRN